MALQINYKDIFGRTNPKAYCNITPFKIAKNEEDWKFYVDFFVSFYVDKAARDDKDRQALWSLRWKVECDVTKNLFEQIYAEVKKMDEFQNALDVFI